ncbi:hypothetical protein H477_3502 [[Clostridium] sordellii ATCC 9714]|nr:hypothetical protein H477_3502 [[Clostridium] sordellii ATCC 9714] [Paeniclostridium sordellii ATCC 9714]
MNNLDKIFIKEFVSKLHSNPFEVKLWDGEEFLVGEGDPVLRFALITL